MAKSTSGTKKLNEALTPDQVSKVEDKYKSIYSGMLKGNKKKLMKYIDPKLKRPNPDAMAMGRAINLVKKETETVNEEIIDWPGEINYGGKRYVFFKQKDGKVTYEHEKYKGDKLTFGSKKEMDDFLGDYTAPKGGTQSSGFGESLNEYINPGYQIETKYFDPNEVKAVADQLQDITGIENIQYKEFKWADGTGGLSFIISSDYRDTGLDYLVRLEHTYDGKWKSKVFATYGAGASEVDFGEVDLNIDMDGFTNMKDITKETFKGVWDKMLRAAAPALKSKRREMEAHQSKSNQRQRDFYKDRGQTSGTIDERLATLVKEVYSEKQRKWACAQDGPEFDEMCKDTAISKKKLKEEMTSTVSKARAKSELKQMLKGKRDDGMGKSTLKAVLAIDKDGKETKVKKLEDFDKFEKGTKFSLKESTDELEKLELDLYNMIQSKTRDSQIVSTYAKYKRKGGKKELGNIAQGLKETTMKNDRLTELIKAALTGPVKEESSTLKEGIWSMGTVTEIENFLRDLNRLKDKYYNIVGSDDVFDGLDQAERSAEEMMMNAPENRHDLDEGMNEELATTPIKDDIYAIGSRIYKDPYEAISLVATDQTVVVRDFARKDKKFKAAVMDYVKSKGLETSVDRDGLYIDTKPLDFKGMPLMNEKSLAESIFKKLRG